MAKLLHISPNIFPPLDVNHHTKRIWKELSQGFDEYHIMARSKDHKFHHYKEGNIYLHLVPTIWKGASFFFTSIYLIKLIKKYKIEVMISQCPIYGGVMATLFSKILMIPVMIEIHGMHYFKIMDSKNLLNKIIAGLIKYSFKNATKVRALSSKMVQMLIERNIPESKIVTIPNRVDLKLFQPPKASFTLQNPIRIVSIGRFVWEKGYEYAIEAIKYLQTKYNIELILIGGGPLYSKYESLISERNKFTFINNLPQEQLVEVLKTADIYIQPSVSEGMPRTILEAMAMQLPIISSDVGAISGVIINNENGLLIKSGDLSSLIEAIELLITNNQLRERIAKKAYSDAKNKYDWDKCFNKYRTEILSMLEEEKGEI